MSDAAAATGAPATFSYKGKEYTIAPMNIDHIAMFERWLENRAFEAINVRKGQIAAEDYEALLGQWVKQCAAGVYSWGSAACSAASRSREGMRFTTFLSLAEHNQGMTKKLAAEIFDAQVKEIEALLEVVNADPFEPAPEQEDSSPTTPSASEK